LKGINRIAANSNNRHDKNRRMAETPVVAFQRGSHKEQFFIFLIKIANC
jgi:hypothetical protein